MSNTKKQPQEAQAGDRVWAKQGETMVAGHITETKIFFGDDRGSMVRIFGSAYGLDEFKDAWGFLADDEAVIGGVLIRPSPNKAAGLWDVGEPRNFWDESIIGNHKGFDDWCITLNLSDADKSAIQAHVRKHSAPVAQPAKAKRTAEDAKEGDEVWTASVDGPQKRCIHKVFNDGVLIKFRERDLRGYKHVSYGRAWGFWEDRPQAQVEQPAPLAEEDKPLPPQLGNVRLLIKAKGIDWVKDNLPDAWEAWKTAGLRKVESAYQELKKPGPLAGKTLRLQ